MLIGHKKQWELLKKKLELNQLSHAYLFIGAKEIGKKTFATEFVKLLNCLSENERPCQKCINCQMIDKNSFPDFKIINKKPDKSEIDISQIREVQNFLSYKSYYGSFKTVVVSDAEKMNQEAQSCFLKTLEEPKGKTLLILVSSKPDMLLGTIASRCQSLKFFRSKELSLTPEKVKKDREITKGLLEVMNADFSEKFKYAKFISAKGESAPGGDYPSQEISEIIEALQRYLRRLLFIKTGIKEPKDQESFPEDVYLLEKYSVKKIKEIINLAEDINNRFLFTNVNPKLALEILLMEL